MIIRFKSANHVAETRRRRRLAASALIDLDEQIRREIGLHGGEARDLAWGIDPRF